MSPRGFVKRNSGRPKGRGGWTRRSTFAIERFPPPLRAIVDHGLAQGKFYREILDELAAHGVKISRDALMRYWQKRWRHQHRELMWLVEQTNRLADMLRHSGESHEAVLARKLLIHQVLSRLKNAPEVELPDLLRESREMVKATRHLDAKSPARALPSPQEIEREVRQIYGWTDEELSRRAKPES